MLALAVLIVGIPLAWLVIKAIQEFCSLIGGYKGWRGDVEELWCMCCERMEQISGIKAATMENWGRDRAAALMTNMQEKVVPVLMNISISGLKSIAGFFWKLLVTLVSTVLLLTDYPSLRERFLGTTLGKIAGRIGKNLMRAGGTYLRAQLIIWCIVSTICVIGLLFTGNRYALLAGIGIGFCDALPFFGTGVIFVPWLILKLFQGEYGLAVLYGALYIICNLVREFVEPKLVGKGMGVHPLAVIFSLYVGICVYGAAGIVLGPVSILVIWELYQMRREAEEVWEE